MNSDLFGNSPKTSHVTILYSPQSKTVLWSLRYMKRIVIPALAFLAYLAGAQTSRANLIANGNFGTDDFSSWTTSSPGGYTSVQPIGNDISPDSNEPADATYEALIGPYPTPTTIAQNITTVAGDVYQFSFDYVHTTYDHDVPAELQAFFGSDDVLTVNGVSDSDPFYGTWQDVSFEIVGDGSTESVGFNIDSAPGYWGLTDVSVVNLGPPSSSVPDGTSTFLLLSFCFGCLALTQIRRTLCLFKVAS